MCVTPCSLSIVSNIRYSQIHHQQKNIVRITKIPTGSSIFSKYIIVVVSCTFRLTIHSHASLLLLHYYSTVDTRTTRTRVKRSAVITTSGGESHSVCRTNMRCTTMMVRNACKKSTLIITNQNLLQDLGTIRFFISPWKNAASVLTGGTCQSVWLEVPCSIGSFFESR